MSNPVVMDLGDFTPEEYHLEFSICGRKYVFEYGEARVDEVFRLIAHEQMTPETQPEIRRRIVTGFLRNHLKDGDPGQFEQDMQLVPYDRPGAPLDIMRLYAPLMMRVKKKSPGESSVRSSSERSG